MAFGIFSHLERLNDEHFRMYRNHYASESQIASLYQFTIKQYLLGIILAPVLFDCLQLL